MTNKSLTWDKFFHSDFEHDTRTLSMAACGAWIRLICHLFKCEPMGQDTRTEKKWAQILRCETAEVRPVFDEIKAEKVAEIRYSNGNVTVANRRLVRMRKDREQTRLRVKKHRSKHPRNGKSNGERLEARGQKLDKDHPLTPSKGKAEEQKIAWSKSGWRNITDEHINEWQEAYPACEIKRQLAAMTAWLKANPKRAKKSNWRRFIVNWLKREQDRGGDLRYGKTGKTKHKGGDGQIGRARSGRGGYKKGERVDPI